MTYDDWKLETPEEEDYRLGAAGRKRRIDGQPTPAGAENEANNG